MVDPRDSEGMTPLSYAVACGNEEEIQRPIEISDESTKISALTVSTGGYKSRMTNDVNSLRENNTIITGACVIWIIFVWYIHYKSWFNYNQNNY